MTIFNQDLGALIGRLCLSIIFLISSIGKIMDFSGTLSYMNNKDLPFAEILLVLAIIIELGGGLMLLLGWKTRIGAWVLLLFVIIVTLVFHNFWTYPPAEATDQMHNFLKNLAILGGLFYVIAFGAGRYSLDRPGTKRLFKRKF